MSFIHIHMHVCINICINMCIYICVCTDVDVHYFPPTNQHCKFQNHHLFSNGHLCHSSILTVLSGWHGLAHKHLPTISGIGIMAAIDSQGRQRGFLRVQDQHFQRWGRNNPFPLILNSPWKPNIWLFLWRKWMFKMAIWGSLDV